jgi:drug/metabolite transporter (DMT)-like permease
MSSLSPNLRGIAFMVIATLVFVINDTLLKLATEGLPPLQVLFMRGIAASFWCLPLVLLTGNGPKLLLLFDRWVLLRNVMELASVVCFILALAKMPIADITALGQIAPMLLLIGVSLLYRDRIGLLRMGLIALGFLGALMVAQPTGTGISVYALLGFGTAFFTAWRDIVGRKVPAEIPALIVAFCTIIMVMVGAGVATALFETWRAPELRHLLLLAGSGFFLTIGHFFIFLAYRIGATGAVAPFYYMFSVWAVVSGITVFGTFPNPVAIAGIGLILASGVVIVLLDERRRRLTVTA